MITNGEKVYYYNKEEDVYDVTRMNGHRILDGRHYIDGNKVININTGDVVWESDENIVRFIGYFEEIYYINESGDIYMSHKIFDPPFKLPSHYLSTYSDSSTKYLLDVKDDTKYKYFPEKIKKINRDTYRFNIDDHYCYDFHIYGRDKLEVIEEYNDMAILSISGKRHLLTPFICIEINDNMVLYIPQSRKVS